MAKDDPKVFWPKQPKLKLSLSWDKEEALRGRPGAEPHGKCEMPNRHSSDDVE